MIIGTAGHIDHGKSTLVKALTGIDPDRLAEERERGITIDLGFAYADIDGRRVGFVDVPGHERLVHNMLAGAAGIDHVLLVVAADDGVMPQTREHLAIVDLLGLRDGAVVLTKIDRVDAERRHAVREQVRTELAGSALRDAPCFEVAAPSGLGLDALRRHIVGAAARISPREPSALFRLAIDRVFTLAGAGLIVTGTVYGGSIAVGAEVLAGAKPSRARVRGLRVQNEPVDTARAGDRCAINLTGELTRDDLRRGDWVLEPSAWMPTDRIDVRLRVLPGEARALKHWTPIHCHVGAADLTGHVAILNDAQRIEPGQADFAQIVLQRAAPLAWGDRVVLRDQSASRTVAGGSVLDPQAPARRRRSPERMRILSALSAGALDTRLAARLALAPLGLRRVPLVAGWAMPPAHIDAAAQAAAARQVPLRDGDAWLVGAGAWQALRDRINATLDQFHAREPDEPGLDRDRLRRIALPTLDRDCYAALIDDGLAGGDLAATGRWLHRAAHRIKLSPQEERFRDKVVPRITGAGFDPPWMRDLAKSVGLDERTTRLYLKRLQRAGALHQVVPDLFFAPQVIEQLIAACRQLEQRERVIRVAELRDALGLGRKRVIQILEYFDKAGITRRVDDDRWLRQRPQ